jgi:hypothetical protein
VTINTYQSATILVLVQFLVALASLLQAALGHQLTSLVLAYGIELQ